MCVTILFSKPSLVRAEQKSGRSNLEKKKLGQSDPVYYNLT